MNVSLRRWFMNSRRLVPFVLRGRKNLGGGDLLWSYPLYIFVFRCILRCLLNRLKHFFFILLLLLLYNYVDRQSAYCKYPARMPHCGDATRMPRCGDAARMPRCGDVAWMSRRCRADVARMLRGFRANHWSCWRRSLSNGICDVFNAGCLRTV